MEIYRDERLLVDLSRQVVVLDNRTLSLTPKEYCLLTLLVQHASAVVPRETIWKRVWGDAAEVRSRRLDIHISGLRKKLRPYADQCIETVAGVGYSFRPIR
jgi:DNA-binding response OmpR family regulator